MNLLDKKIYPLDGMEFPILHNISNNEIVTVSFKNARFKIHNCKLFFRIIHSLMVI